MRKISHIIIIILQQQKHKFIVHKTNNIKQIKNKTELKERNEFKRDFP